MDNKTAAVNLLNLTANASVNALPNIGKATQAADISFSETFMKSSANGSVNDVSGKVTATKTVVESNATGGKNIKSAEDINKQDAKSLNKDEAKDIAKEISKAVDEIKDEIKSKFSVSDEDIEKAMEVLSLTAGDLFNQADLRSLVMELTGTADSIELITNVELYEGLKEITAFADGLLTEASEEFGLSKDQLKDFLESDAFKAILNEAGMDESEIPEELSTEDFEKVISTQTVETDNQNVDASENENEAIAKVADKPVSEKADTEEKRPEVKVEVERTTEARTADPIKVDEQPANDSMNQQSGNKKNNLFETGKGEVNVVQTQTTQTVNTVGDIVETVTSYTTNANAENIMRQVTDYVRVNITEDVTKMEMQLHPASLGTVNMQINSQNGQITAHLTVQNELVKSVLESQMIKLQETFDEQGTKVTAIEVSVATYNLDAKSDNNYSQERENRGGQSKGRRGLVLDEISSFDELTDEEQLEAEVMKMNGGSVTYTA